MEKTKSLKEMAKFIEELANKEMEKFFDKEKYEEYKRILSILDTISDEKPSFSYVVGEINAYLR